jgi:cell division septal protein FtsQ
MVKVKQPRRSAEREIAEPESAEAPAPPRWRGWFRPTILASLALAAAAVLLWPHISKFLPDISQRGEYRVAVSDIEISRPPHWVPQTLIQQVAEQASLPEHVSLLDDSLVETVARAFRQHPWVEKVVRVRKSYPARLEVELEYRKPVAMVEVKQGLYPIDASGILLPPTDFSITDTKNYPLVSSVRTTPQSAAGNAWGDPVVLGAAQISAVLSARWKEFSLVEIRVPTGSAEDGVYQLYTKGGSRIVWGRSPASDHPGELSAEQKVGRMEEYVNRFGGFDQPNGPYEIDIRHLQEISRKRLASDQISRPRR